MTIKPVTSRTQRPAVSELERRSFAEATNRIVERPNCSYTIQTVSGFYLAVGPGSSTISTRISNPKATPSIGYNAKFELIMLGL
jgi:hypothetical protein